MRIIGGKLKGLRIHAPNNLPVRPTTDMAKEALFNILHNQYNINDASVLDLFSGTGNIGLEFASRDASSVTCVDLSNACVRWIQSISKKHNLNIQALKSDSFQFLKNHQKKYDFIFADPPYQLRNIPEITHWVFQNELLTTNGVLIIEHQSLQKMEQVPYFELSRKYGNSTFSFFSQPTHIMKKIALFPGSFDPITVAHVDIVNRSLPLFDEIVVGIGLNSSKQHLLSAENRQEMIAKVFENEKKIKVMTYEGLTVDFCKKINANYMIRGIRSAADFEYERAIAQINSTMLPEVETLLILSKAEYSAVSSTIVRDILRYKGDITPFVPQIIVPYLKH